MNISAVAERTGVPVKTIRYYEEIGLLRPARTANGYRAFSAADAHKLAFLARARSLGFSIDDCRSLLSLYEDRSRASSDVKRLAAEHLDRITDKILELETMRRTLQALVSQCHGDKRPDCPILNELAAGPGAAPTDA